MIVVRFLLALVLVVGLASAAFADSREDWSGYDWKTVRAEACADLGLSGVCAIHDAKWDWKRAQWVRLFLSRRGGTLTLNAQLDNRDRADDDFVCIVVLFQDDAGDNAAALFLNVHSDPQTVSTFETSGRFDTARLAAVRRLVVGTKQCRKGAQQDEALFEQVQSALR